MKITKEYLRNHPKYIFVFGDNVLRTGYGGSAALRDVPNTYGFVTKIRPNNNRFSYFDKTEYEKVLEHEMMLLEDFIERTYDCFTKFLIPKLGSSLANRYDIWDLIEPRLRKLKEDYPENVVLLWEEEP